MVKNKRGAAIMFTSFHTHCYFCDGVQEPKVYVEKALERGIEIVGFSSHAPIPFENSWTMKEERVEAYLKTIEDLKEEYKDRIEIYTGLEVDFIEKDSRKIFEKYKLDYTIGSVHLFPKEDLSTYYSVDGNDLDFQKTLNEFFQGDIKKFVRKYYQNISAMLLQHKPNILGHFDIIKKNNSGERYFSENDPWYKSAVLEVLPIIKESGSVLEVNTGGILRGYIKDPYPSLWILRECIKLDIPVLVTSDAHAPEHMKGFYDLAFYGLREVGYTEQRILKDGKWMQDRI